MLRWYLTRPYWLYWTMAGRGARDGRINHPKDGVAQEMRPEIGQLDLVGAFLREIELRAAVQRQEGRPTPPRGDSGDYDAAVQALESVMRARHLPLDSLPASARQELVKLMVDLIDQHTKSNRNALNALTHYEAEVIAIAEEKIEAIWEHWQQSHNSIEAKAEAVQKIWKNASREYEGLNELHIKKEYRQPHPLIPRWFYLIFIAGLVCAEYWINSLAFRLFFESKSFELYVSAALPAFAIPFFAHVVGTQVRYWQGKRENKEPIRVVSVIMVLGSLITAIAAASALVWFRSEYVSFVNREPIDWRNSTGMLMLNVTGLFTGIAAAYIAHDVDGTLESICQQKKKLLKSLLRTWDQWARLAAKFDTLRGRCIAEVGKIRADTIAKIMEYRDYNIRYRADGSVPAVFRSEVGDRFFKPRDFSHDLSITPPPVAHLEAILQADLAARRIGMERPNGKGSEPVASNSASSQQPDAHAVNRAQPTTEAA